MLEKEEEGAAVEVRTEWGGAVGNSVPLWALAQLVSLIFLFSILKEIFYTKVFPLPIYKS